MKDPRDIIKRPIITEASSDLMENLKYTFEVDVNATKIDIKHAVQEIFKVKVKKVNTLNMPKKPKRYGRHSGYTSEWKKAYVTLTDDSKPLDFFETV
ncbi:50S ribosomal protein L23 [Longirhabdus pacifica]|uniref:50S ribosomal protein L23 n=1 Tax=Longirhabdus pacifica TaxID=2305227 RepID=UPI0010089ADA|nr:50S ribosomal protein L23 [Longirhabdus pacifica]